MSDTCVFCGTTGTNFKPEHWVSQWISRADIPRGKGILHVPEDGDPWPSRLVDLTVQHVCNECNHHWMSDIETRTRNIALPLIQGKTGISLTPAQQAQLATWCFLKAITLELGRPSNQRSTFPPLIYEGFKIHKTPPASCLITIGYREFRGDPPVYVWFKSQGQNHPFPGMKNVDGYRTALTIRHLVIEVFGVLVAPAIVHADDDDRFIRIWPVSEPLDWPPPTRFQGIVSNNLV